jgi:surface antigen
MHSSHLSRRTGLVTTLVLGVAAALLAPVAPASGATTTLCSGYERCAQKGKSAAGYKRAGKRSYWRMYPGHNCTNYVAYRLVRKGMRNVRPWSGPGNATHWGRELHRRTDKRPRVGSVAWWKAGTGPGGSSGHVAYVEKVISRSQIVVSQDSWGGDFSWARITRSRGWPSGFIHLRDTPLRNVAAPSVSGTRRVGGQLVASRGSWTPKPASVRYRWLVGGRAVPGADTRKLRLNRHMRGKRVQVRVVASRLGYPRTTATSRATGKVEQGRFAQQRRPDLKGHAQVTRSLRVSPGSWSPRPKRVTYRWLADGKRLERSTSRKLRLGPGLVKARIAVEVTARRPGYAPRTRTLRADRRVAPARLRTDRRPALVGTAHRGRTLRVRLGQTAPRADVRRVRWLRDGRPVRGATDRRYRLRSGDLGHHIRAQVTYRRPGYERRTLLTDRSSRVKATPRVKVTAEARRHAVRLTVTGRGAGRPLSTQVVATRSGRVLDRDTMHRGRAVLRLTGLRPGRRAVRVLVRGTPTTTRYGVKRTVRVRR